MQEIEADKEWLKKSSSEARAVKKSLMQEHYPELVSEFLQKQKSGATKQTQANKKKAAAKVCDHSSHNTNMNCAFCLVLFGVMACSTARVVNPRPVTRSIADHNGGCLRFREVCCCCRNALQNLLHGVCVCVVHGYACLHGQAVLAEIVNILLHSVGLCRVCFVPPNLYSVARIVFQLCMMVASISDKAQCLTACLSDATCAGLWSLQYCCHVLSACLCLLGDRT